MSQASITSLFTPSSSKSTVAPSSSGAHRRRRSEADDAPPASAPGPSKRSRPDPGPSPRVGGASSASSRLQAAAPLADRLRPQSMEEYVGQPHLTGRGSLLMHLLDSGATGSMIFWGPPGCGKTTLARLLASRTDAVFKELSATDSGISDVRSIADEAKRMLALTGKRTILFLDEVHRFNKAQQDIFLPYIEHGHLQLIGATTENPSFKLTGALLSRCRVFVLERLTDEDIKQIVTQAVERVSGAAHARTTDPPDEDIAYSSQPEEEPMSSPTLASQHSSSGGKAHFPTHPQLTERILSSIVSLSAGDARTALSLLELVLSSPQDADEGAVLDSLRRSVSTSYDRTGDSRYDMISALHKSVRGSNGSAALYWLARMLTAGEDPLYIARRMAVCASEDIGLADNHALPLAMATFQACQAIGMPECRINLAHLVSYLSEAPKSTRSYEAYSRAEEAAKSDPTLPVPLVVRNAPTGLMKNLGYGEGYRYNPEYAHPVTNEYLPAQFKDEVFLRPEGDKTDKLWDEDALRKWELEENGGKLWEGRSEAQT
ncbi:P-loop containing nucleoside triphosphate hydrolase protein [Obba rivulosa]|uniref:P-loop containing nucleoside triphosphate hydrolase protein n=1 Tax=Obba rivulosa TaxID=1052685 RepID=A0A8E2AR76_9APHY|nr:P-loop containing nucleoside triphosphate hydrolase protein [Obba rivulosa]